jgi:hypothetical protein
MSAMCLREALALVRTVLWLLGTRDAAGDARAVQRTVPVAPVPLRAHADPMAHPPSRRSWFSCAASSGRSPRNSSLVILVGAARTL